MNKRTVLITGGTRGIGLETVKKFADSGYNIAFCYKNSEKAAYEIIAELIKKEINCLAVKCDVSKIKEVKKMYSKTKEAFGFVDTVVNNAGKGRIKLFTDEDENGFDEIADNNLKSVFNVCSIYAPDMISNKFGRIINISSVFGVSGASMESLYSMTKAGIIGLTKSLALEFASSQVTANVIAPGLIDTDMNKCYTKSEMQDIIKNIPLGRIGTAKEIASAIHWLADKDSGFITGQVININGGGL